MQPGPYPVRENSVLSARKDFSPAQTFSRAPIGRVRPGAGAGSDEGRARAARSRALIGRVRPGRNGRLRGGPEEAGSAAVEFVASVVLLTLVFVASVEVGIYAFVRNVAQAAAVEAARHAAPVGRGEGAGTAHIGRVLPETLGGYSRDLTARVWRSGPFVRVAIEGRVRSMSPLVPDLPLRVEAWAFQEGEVIRR